MKNKNFETLTSLVDRVVSFGATTIGTGCTLSIFNKLLHEKITMKCHKYKKQYKKGQKTIRLFDKLYRKSLSDNLIDKNEYEGLCKVFNKNVDEKNMNFFKKVHNKQFFFCTNKVYLEHRT